MKPASLHVQQVFPVARIRRALCFFLTVQSTFVTGAYVVVQIGEHFVYPWDSKSTSKEFDVLAASKAFDCSAAVTFAAISAASVSPALTASKTCRAIAALETQ